MYRSKKNSRMSLSAFSPFRQKLEEVIIFLNLYHIEFYTNGNECPCPVLNFLKFKFPSDCQSGNKQLMTF